jgi:mono/diheme cytochrome c family protein
MPGFAGALTDAQVVALLQYLRTEVARKPPWPQLDEQVRAIAAEQAGD